MTLTECYARLGINVKNPRTAWSEQAEDGTVVVTLWSDRFLDVNRNSYSSGHHKPRTIDRRENKLRIQRLQHAQNRNACIFQSIIVTHKGSHNDFELGGLMKLTHLDEVTGEFRAERAGD